MGSLAAMTSLPNLHPAVVHFPIALLLCALGFDAASLLLRRWAWLDRTAAALFVLGAASAWAAVLTGERAADSLVGVPSQVQPFINEHQDWAERTAWFFSVVTVLRLALGLARRVISGSREIAVRALLLTATLAGQWLLLGTADRGGALVYVHGLAVARLEIPGQTAAPPAVAASPEARLTRTADGILWTPAPGDAAALGSVVDLLPGSAMMIIAAGSDADGAIGLALEVSGRSLLVLPDELGDVEVEAKVDISGFRGVLGLIHHVHAMNDGGAFELASDGRAALVSEAAKGRRVLDEAACTLPAGPFTLAVSAAGHHYKGMVEGATVVHGHLEPALPGRVGLLFDGQGIVRVHSLSVVRLEEHES